MEAVYRNEKEIFVKLDGPEVRLIMKALDELRYAPVSMMGSQLVDLAGLSMEWMCLCQDIGGKRWSSPEEFLKAASKVAGIDIVKTQSASLYGKAAT